LKLVNQISGVDSIFGWRRWHLCNCWRKCCCTQLYWL